MATYSTVYPAAATSITAGKPTTTAPLLYHGINVDYNFTSPRQLDSGLNMLLILIVMIILVIFSTALHKVIQRVVLVPLQDLLDQVRDLATTMFESVRDMSSAMKGDDDDEGGVEGETDEKIEDIEDLEEGEAGAFEETVGSFSKRD